MTERTGLESPPIEDDRPPDDCLSALVRGAAWVFVWAVALALFVYVAYSSTAAARP